MQTRSKTLSQCEAAWRAGIPLKVTADGFPIVMKPSMNCEYTVEGTQDIAYVGFPQDIPKPELLERIRQFLVTIPRLTAEQFEEAPDGVYTWILASVGGSEPTFFASRTTAMLELGTVHYSIATAIGATAVHGAGEVWKHGDEFTFNFLSGTFMDKWKDLLPKDCPLKTMQAYLKETLKKDIFPYLFRGKSLAFREDNATFVNTRFLTLTTAELEGYVKAGFVVCIHDKSKKAECKSTKSACQKPVTLEQMKGGTPPTPRRPGTPSQFSVAKDMLALGEAMRPAPSASFVPVVPAKYEGKVKGLGGRKRKTRKTKARRRKTRRRLRGGVDEDDWADLDPAHVGVRMANDVLRDPPLNANAAAFVPRTPEQQMFDRITQELQLTHAQQEYMHRTYADAMTRGIPLPEARLRLHMQTYKQAHPR